MTAMASGKDERDADFLEMASVSSSPERLPIALAGREWTVGWNSGRNVGSNDGAGRPEGNACNIERSVGATGKQDWQSL
jgi:hypothetical protein